MKTVKLQISVNASKAESWDLLFNRFGEVNVFNPVIEGSHHTTGAPGEVGCERQCDIDSKTSIHEKIVAARGNESFDIEIIEGGLPLMDKMYATFSLSETAPNKTVVEFTMKFNTKPAFMAFLMKGMLAKMLYKMLIGLKYHLETGSLVTKENIGKIEKQYKQLPTDESFTQQPAMSIA
ncbi:MAG: SRPBCC family protein [Flavobacteriales bacterium]|nr:SRPBCC family protein [Flavobacteriales bacterium]